MDHALVNANMLAKNSEGAEIEKPNVVHSSSLSTHTNASPPSSPGPTKPTPTMTKGFGLKKWRRIRREITKDATITLDTTKMLKRGSAILDPKQPTDGDGSTSSVNAFVQSSQEADHFAIPGSSSSYRLAVDTIFSAGADSDNSDDRSSKSSTAASAPKYRYDVPRVQGRQREKHRLKNLTGKDPSAIGIGIRAQAGKILMDTSKKPRGESSNLEKETSLSSLESDSRSCNSMFIRGTSSVIGDHAQVGRPINSDAEDTYDEPASEEQSAEDLQADCGNNITSCIGNKGTSKNHQLPRDCDPLVDSILLVQSAQVALERELQKFREIGKGIRSLCEDSSENHSDAAYPLSVSPEHCTDSTSVYLNKDVEILERQVNEAEIRLKEKNSSIIELEVTIKNMESLREDIRSTIELQHMRFREMEAELDILFRQKVEAEVEYVAFTRCTEELNMLVLDQIKVLREQKSTAKEQVESLSKTTDIENKVFVLQGRADGCHNACEEMAGGEEILSMQGTVVKFTKCLFIQLFLLVLVFGLFLLQLLPKSAVVVPT